MNDFLRPTKTRDEVLTPCRLRTDLFDSETPDARKYQAAVCASCEFVAVCDVAVTTIKKSTGLPRGGKPKDCGTFAAYRRHIRNGEVPCQPCKDANAAHGRHPGLVIECRDCGRSDYNAGRTLCMACYARHQRARTLDQFPRLTTRDGAA